MPTTQHQHQASSCPISTRPGILPRHLAYPQPCFARSVASPQIYYIVVGKGKARRLVPRLGSCLPPDKKELPLCGRVGPRVPCRPPRLNITNWVKWPAKQPLACRTSKVVSQSLAEVEFVMRLFSYLLISLSWLAYARQMGE